MFVWLRPFFAWIASLFTRRNTFTACCLAIAGVFGLGFFQQAGVPPTSLKDHWPLLAVFLIFFLLPFSKKVDFFQFFSFEADLAAVKKEVGETNKVVASVQDDIRHVINLQNALSVSVKSQNNNTIHLYDRPGSAQVDAAVEEVKDVAPVGIEDAPPQEGEGELPAFVIDTMRAARETMYSEPREGSWHEYLSSRTNDDIAVEAKFRASLEVYRAAIHDELRRLLTPILSGTPQNRDGKIPSLLLFRKATRIYPELLGVHESFDVFMKISAATYRGRVVPLSDLKTADWLGSRVLNILKKLEVAPAPVTPKPSENPS